MTVFLVGAGPGDPGLITVRGLERVRAPRCWSTTGSSPTSSSPRRRRALRIGREPIGQERINRLLVALRPPRRPRVRLKGGDPFVFGRGGEEALALVEAGVEFEVVPGVSSIAAVPARGGHPRHAPRSRRRR